MFVALDKKSKKAQKEFYRSLRVQNQMNTGSRTMKTQKRPSRAMIKDADRKGRELY